MVRAFEPYLGADVKRSCHHVAGLVRDERVAAREEALRGPDQRDRTIHTAHLFCGRAALCDRGAVLFRRRARSLGIIAALDLTEVVEVVICEVGWQILHLQVLVGEPEIEVGFRALENHVQAPEGSREALLQRGGLLFLFFGQLFWRALHPGPAAVEQDDGAHAVGVREGRLQGYEGAHRVSREDGALQTEVVQDADHVGRVRFEAVARLGFARVSAAAQVHAYETARRAEVACRGVEGPVLGRDAVQADHGVGAIPGAADREFHVAGDAFMLPDILFHGRGLYAKAFGGAADGNLPG